MTKKDYKQPESKMLEVTTEQGICYSSNEEAKVKADVEVSAYDQVDNEITFD